MSDLIVQKYGGSSLSTPDQIRQVAQRIARRCQAGQQIIVVVSAMGRATDELLHLAYKVSSQPNRRELDMLLTAGERVSMALMSMALHDLGCPSLSLTGSQAGVFTDSSHSNARILDLRPTRVAESLSQGKIVVLAGFQGVDPHTKEVTTLGRGGSDTTAVAMAAYFQARRCEILKDVDGIFSADPKIVNNARLYDQFPYPALEESCYWGAKVLHYRSVELAQALRVPLFVGHAHRESQGTIITEATNIHSTRQATAEESSMYEESRILTVNTLSEVHHLALSCSHPDEGLNALEQILLKNQLSWPQILATVFEAGEWRAMISSSSEQMLALKSALKSTPFRFIKNSLCGVTLTCRGSYASRLTRIVMGQLQKSQIVPYKTLHTGTSMTVFVDPDHRDQTVQALHQLVPGTGW